MRDLRPAHAPVDSVEIVARAIEPLSDAASGYESLLELIGDARFVLIGEASHGTHEFYAERAVITRRLILEQKFSAVCIEGDWPDAHRVDCWVKGISDDRSPEQALEGFRRFPTWMWRNEVVRDFIAWLRGHNMECGVERRVGFYGLDLYRMFGSIQSVLSYLDRVDPDAARRARSRYSCFEHFGADSQAYGYATAAEMAEPCADDAVRQLVDLRTHARHCLSTDGRPALDEFFSAEQNARLIQNAEHYYRAMYRGRVSSWNLRDEHMADTLDAIETHLRTGDGPRSSSSGRTTRISETPVTPT